MKYVWALSFLLLGSMLAFPIAIGGPLADVSSGTVAATTDESSANETVRHQNPSEYDEAGDSERVSNWLSDQLSSRLSESTTSISQSEYDFAREIVGEEYQEQVDQYVELEGESDGSAEDTGSDDVDDINHTYAEIADVQIEYADHLEQYNNTETDYQQAFEAGDIDQARTFTRELIELSDDIDTLTTELIELYTVLEGETDDNFTAEKESLNETRDDILDERAAIEEQVFVDTELDVDAETDTASFLEPVQLRGEFRSADETLPANHTIDLEINENTHQTAIEEDGTFELPYRPVNLSTETDNITVSYVPGTNTTHLGTETTVNISVEQTQPAISIDNIPESGSYNESAILNGRVAVQDEPVDNVSLDVMLGDARVAQPNVVDGEFETTFTVPASVRSGETSLRVAYPHDDHAIGPANVTSPILIEETETVLEVDAEQTEDTLSVTGTLETDDREPVPNQAIDIDSGIAPETTVQTDDNGAFTETLEIPSTADEETTVAAIYSGEGTNLNSATGEATTSIAVDGSENPSSRLWIVAAVGALSVLVGVGFIVWYRRRDSSENHTQLSDNQSISDSVQPTPSPQPFLSQSKTAIENEIADEAIKAAYTAVRQDLGADIENHGQLTHWEFYHQYTSDTDIDVPEEVLQELTSHYEQAAFAVEQPSLAEAKDTLELAKDLCTASQKSA